MPTERLQKFLSNAGIASRRRAETLIERGQVKINGVVAKLGDKVDPQVDKITYNGKTLKPEQKLFYIAVNKPTGYISSRFDPRKRKSVYQLVPRDIQSKIWTVGRLDYFTEGLVLFTNDGDLTQQLAHPKYEHEKEYEVEVSGSITEAQMDTLRHGIEIGAAHGEGSGYTTAPAKVRSRSNKIYMTIHEGKKRQIRRMFDKLGLKIKRLKRIRINKLELGNLASGKWKHVTREEIL